MAGSRTHAVLGSAMVLILGLTACSGDGQSAEGNQSGDGTAEASTAPTTEAGPPPDEDGATETVDTDESGDGTTGTAGPEVADVGGDAYEAPDAAAIDQARSEVEQLEMHELAGQLIVASYGGTDSTAAATMVTNHHLGGVITLGDNVPAAPSERLPALSDLSRRVNDAVAADGRDWPAFIAVDQEGGPITRVAAPLDTWPAAMALGAAGDIDLARDVAHASGEQLRALGYTVVLAPVADVTSGQDDPTIGARSFGSDAEAVAGLTQAQVNGYLDADILPVIKHFPGHGSVPADTHLESVRQEASLEDLFGSDLVPFAQLADAGAPAVMTAHITVDAVDPDRPATLSASVLTELLRDEMGFEGLVVTDAMNMAAISDTYGPDAAAVAALEAGADVILMPTDPQAAIEAIEAAVEDGTLDRGDLEDSAARMIAHLRSVDGSAPEAGVIGDRADLAAEAAAAAITQISGPCDEALVSEGIQIVGGSEEDRALLSAAAQEAGLEVGTGPSVALLGAPVYQAGGGGGDAGSGVQGDIVVALDVPYRLADSSAEIAMFAIYGRDAAAFEALVDVLTGAEPAPGSLPVAVGDLPVGSGC